jgi:hypothetical protein
MGATRSRGTPSYVARPRTGISGFEEATTPVDAFGDDALVEDASASAEPADGLAASWARQPAARRAEARARTARSRRSLRCTELGGVAESLHLGVTWRPLAMARGAAGGGALATSPGIQAANLLGDRSHHNKG